MRWEQPFGLSTLEQTKTAMAKWKEGLVADMLRAAGYVPLPRLWVRREQLSVIMEMAEENKDAVLAIRRHCHAMKRKEAEEEAAWAEREES